MGPSDQSDDFRLPRAGHWLTRTVVLRMLGLVYAVAFATLVTQLRPLFGARGLLPAKSYLAAVAAELGGRGAGFWAEPSMFWVFDSDTFMIACAWLGLGASVLVALGATNALVMALLWALYLSFVHVGQIWYGYGWEILLLEAGFLAIFYCPLTSVRPLPPASPPPALVTWLYRWLAVRVMLGAGLIKVRGDACWRELTCMQFHYETQPVPNPMSWLLHKLPASFHGAEVLFNHFVELIVPFAALAPRPYRTIAGCLMVAFQLTLIVSGNLSFLNWLTLAVCLACLDDEPLLRLLGPRLRERSTQWLAERTRDAKAWPYRAWVMGALGAVVGVLSLNPIINMMSPAQAMNSSFDRLHLVNTYGAFGSIDKERFELVIEGTDAPGPDEQASWRQYELPCKPGDPDRRPCVISPYHYRLDWQIWWPFNERRRPIWMAHLLYKLLVGDDGVMELFANRPFPDAPPRWVRVQRYRYRYSDWGESGWWRRELVDTYFPAVSREEPELVRMLRARRLLAEPAQ